MTRIRSPRPDRRTFSWAGAVLVSMTLHALVLLATPGPSSAPVWVQVTDPILVTEARPEPAAPSGALKQMARAQAARTPQPASPAAQPPESAPLLANAEDPPAMATVVTEALDSPRSAETTPLAAEPVESPLPVATPAPEDPPVPPGPLWLPGQAAQLSGAQQAAYQIEGTANGLAYHASASLNWSPEPDQRYTLAYKVGAFLLGSRSQLSQGLRSATGLEPRTFVDQSRRTQTTTVDAERQLVQFPNQATPQPWQPGVQDRLSVFVQLGAWVASAPLAFDKGQSFKLSVWSSRQAETWLVAAQGREKTATPYGDTMAVRLRRLPLGPGDAQIDVWYVPEWSTMPVRVEWAEANGNRVEQTLKGLEPPPDAKPPQAR